MGPKLSESSRLLPPTADAYADVKFKDLYPGKIFYKKQYRYNNMTRQLVVNDENRWINMEATTINCQLYRIYGWVKREQTAALKKKDKNGEVAIRNQDTGEILNLIKDKDTPTPIQNGFLQPFSVDLHNIYKGNDAEGIPGTPVFELSRADKERKLNIFQLVVQMEFIDGSFSQKFTSPVFNLRTLDPPKGKVLPGGKRPRVSETASPGGSVDSGTFDDGRQQKILVDMLDAKTAEVDKVVVKNLQVNGILNVNTTGADLAYHLTLKEPEKYGDLQEGDIVGFYKDEESGETYIQRLRSNNIHNALHTGVVSRSHWLAGHKPLNPATKTDTICVIGIVNVKVVGSIENGERIYASTDRPGKAIPQSHMPVGSFLRKKHALLGMALETKKSKTLDDVHLVKCFVCIVLDVSRKELLEEIEDLYQVNEERTAEQIKIASKKTWRRLKGCALSTLIIIGVIIFILYQWLVPGSMFQYWLCRQGSIPDHHLYYTYVDTNNGRHFQVHGIEFTWQGLQDKVGFKFLRDTLETKWLVHYYLNVDRCAYYWEDGAAGNNIGGRKYIGGSRILSAVKRCTIVDEMIDGNDVWTIVKNQSNVSCIPMP
ncbi:Hypothetical predicted protein [Paramuricea clavata]|nr:Hypothetical predicted protein [Paramuricea clavata]